MPEGIFQGAIEDVDANVEKLLNRIPVPPHLLFLCHSFRNCHVALNEENAESLLSRSSPFLVIFVLYEKRRIFVV